MYSWEMSLQYPACVEKAWRGYKQLIWSSDTSWTTKPFIFAVVYAQYSELKSCRQGHTQIYTKADAVVARRLQITSSTTSTHAYMCRYAQYPVKHSYIALSSVQSYFSLHLLAWLVMAAEHFICLQNDCLLCYILCHITTALTYSNAKLSWNNWDTLLCRILPFILTHFSYILLNQWSDCGMHTPLPYIYHACTQCYRAE